MWSLLRRLPWTVWMALSAGVAIFSYRYGIGIGPLPEEIVTNLFAFPWLTLHAVAASTALLLAPLQFLARLRSRFPHIHRFIGRLYVMACLAGGVTGLPLAWGTTAGPVAGFGFGLLAMFWLVTTITAWRFAVARRFAEHRAWMIRSVALTAAGITLRLYLGVLIVLPIEFVDGYRLIAYLCWIPNLLLAEFYLRSGRRPDMPAVA